MNCATFSETLLESELFGYEKGAFTDAKAQKRGLAEIADGGTLFLDEVGEIPFHFQAKLLRFLEHGEIRRVGGTKDIALNVRILCATNQPLEAQVEQNRFRSDLYYRLNVLSVTVPPLKDRVEDIPLLVDNFVRNQGIVREFDKSAIDLLKTCEWHGNVRELKNVIERTCILTPRKIVTADDLSFLRTPKKSADRQAGVTVQNQEPSFSGFAEADVPRNGASTADSSAILSLKDMERRHIIYVLSLCNGHKGKASKLLEINPKTLYLKMKAYNIISVYE